MEQQPIYIDGLLNNKAFFPYNIVPTTYLKNASVIVEDFCNSLTIINQGATLLTINSTIFLYPGTVGTNNGESYTFGGNLLEIFKGRIDIQFATGVGNAAIIQKIYTDKQ